jgi:hypothetical protein
MVEQLVEQELLTRVTLVELVKIVQVAQVAVVEAVELLLQELSAQVGLEVLQEQA